MKRTGNVLPRGRLFGALSSSLALVLVLSACSGSLSPQDVVNLYLSDVSQGKGEKALERWELSEVGPTPDVLDAEQERIRIDGRRDLATGLTEALAAAGQRLRWAREGVSYYEVRDDGTLLVKEGSKNVNLSIQEGAKNPNLAIVEMRLATERTKGATLEEQVAFNLWRNPKKDWRITGLDKGLNALRPFLEEVRSDQ